jgi:CubicO group peptidase (beta-lactamase class C family)
MYTADMVGRRLPVSMERGELSFELPNGEGSFRGKFLAGGDLIGHWYRLPASNVASPVRLKPESPDRWRGEVAPPEDVVTFYLMLRKQPDGSLGAFLHNPERGFGAWVDRLVRDGDEVMLIGKPPGQNSERELSRGTYDPERQVITLAVPSRGGSYDFRREGEESDFYPRGKNPGRYLYRPPLACDDGWPTGTLEESDIDRAGIETFIQRILDTPMESRDTPQVHGILIARHGKLVLEEYFHGEHRDKLHDTRSASKSLTATLVGAAIHAGAPLELSTPVYQIMNGGTFPAGLEPRKRAMTLEHLLTMSSGFFCDDTNPDAPGSEERMQEQSEEPDWYRYTLNVPMASAPGEEAVYCSINPNLALGVVARATGEDPRYTFDRLLGGPLKIHRYGWFSDPAGHPYGGGGVLFLPRDFMKLGQLMLNEGTWQGHRILSREFVARASAPLYHLRNLVYGYQWWGIDYPYKDRTVHAFFAGGAGGQVVMVIRELDLVIAIYAGNYSSGRTASHIQQELIPRYILPAVREPGDDKGAPVIPREYVTPYGRSPYSGPVSRTRVRPHHGDCRGTVRGVLRRRG